MGEFSLRPQQGDVRAVFVPLKGLQQALDLPGRVNALLVSGRPGESTRPALEAMVRRQAALEDLGLTVRVLDAQGVVSVESQTGLLDDVRATAVERAAVAEALSTRPVFSYLVSSLRSGDRTTPYSLVTATDLTSVASVPLAAGPGGGLPPIVLNDWAARDLAVAVGSPLTLEFSVWEEPGQLATRTADFQVAAIVPIAGPAADRSLAPVYPGITESARLGDWDPPFPIDLKRVRPVDEDYWNRYRTTPKGFLPFDVGRMLWRSRYGDRTSVRLMPASGESLISLRDRYATRLRAAVDPLAMGMTVRDVRTEGLAASGGATDFGEYFTYFSFFLVVSALLLAALFFRLGVEQRVREVGLLRAVGFTTIGVSVPPPSRCMCLRCRSLLERAPASWLRRLASGGRSADWPGSRNGASWRERCRAMGWPTWPRHVLAAAGGWRSRPPADAARSASCSRWLLGAASWTAQAPSSARARRSSRALCASWPTGSDAAGVGSSTVAAGGRWRDSARATRRIGRVEASSRSASLRPRRSS